MHGRDKTSLSGRSHRLLKGVLTHRPFRVGLIIARTQGATSSPQIAGAGAGCRPGRAAGLDAATRASSSRPRLRTARPGRHHVAQARQEPAAGAHAPGMVGHQGEPRRARFRKPPHPASATTPAPAGKAQARTKQPGRWGPVRGQKAGRKRTASEERKGENNSL